jgi:hypothetical protein
MTELENKVTPALSSLIGLNLTIAKSTGDLRAFHFGAVEVVGKALMGMYSLHLSCPWRIEKDEKIIIGSGDHYERAEDNKNPTWEVGMIWGTYQQQVLRQILGGVDPETNTIINDGELMVVESVAADSYCGATISFSTGYRLVVFPSSARGEHWRLLPPGDGPHFVVEAGEAYGGWT